MNISHFNDLLLIPCALPTVLLLQRWCKLRSHDEPPRPGEILSLSVFMKPSTPLVRFQAKRSPSSKYASIQRS